VQICNPTRPKELLMTRPIEPRLPPVTLPPDVFEAIVTALAQTLADTYRTHWQPAASIGPAPAPDRGSSVSPWLTVREAAARARCGSKLLYRDVSAGRLKAVRIDGRRSVRFRAEWIDAWLERNAVETTE
jgi:excisionase family DNA binding protein